MEYDNNMSTLSELCACVCVFLVPIATITYEVFGIVYLIENYKDIDDSCIGQIWPYVLVSLLLATSNIGMVKNEKSVPENISALICLVLLNAGLAVWGGLELSYPLCQDKMDTHLWKFGFATFILQSFTGVLVLIVVCCGIIVTSIPNTDRSMYNEV